MESDAVAAEAVEGLDLALDLAVDDGTFRQWQPFEKVHIVNDAHRVDAVGQVLGYFNGHLHVKLTTGEEYLIDAASGTVVTRAMRVVEEVKTRRNGDRVPVFWVREIATQHRRACRLDRDDALRAMEDLKRGVQPRVSKYWSRVSTAKRSASNAAGPSKKQRHSTASTSTASSSSSTPSTRSSVDTTCSSFGTPTCTLCAERPCEVAFVPCFHMCICTVCSAAMGTQDDCPICRNPSLGRQRIYVQSWD